MPLPPNGERYPLVGGRVDSLSKWDSVEATKLPENAVRTHRLLHAVVGVFWIVPDS